MLVYLLNPISHYSERNSTPPPPHTQYFKTNETRKGIKKAGRMKGVILKKLSLVSGKCQEPIAHCLQRWRTPCLQNVLRSLRDPSEDSIKRLSDGLEVELHDVLWHHSSWSKQLLEGSQMSIMVQPSLGCHQRSSKKIGEQHSCSNQAMTWSSGLCLWWHGGMQGGHPSGILDYFMKEEDMMMRGYVNLSKLLVRI